MEVIGTLQVVLCFLFEIVNKKSFKKKKYIYFQIKRLKKYFDDAKKNNFAINFFLFIFQKLTIFFDKNF